MRIFSVIKRALVEFNLCFVPTSLVVDAGCLVYPFVTIFACIFQIETLTLSFICTYNHAWLFATVWENLLIYVIFWRSHSFFLFFFLFGLSFLALKKKSIVCCKTKTHTRFKFIGELQRTIKRSEGIRKRKVIQQRIIFVNNLNSVSLSTLESDKALDQEPKKNLIMMSFTNTSILPILVDG